jgi:imidazolonepropionase
MKTVIQNLAKLTHFDDHGDFFTKKNCSIEIDDNGIITSIRENGNITASGSMIDGSGLIGLPSFIDAHTHTLFAGNRAHEFQMKVQGKTYLEIAKEGGGIPHTQASTKKATESELIELVGMRLKKFREQGVLGVEIKTGYGLSHDEEIRHLRILQKIKDQYRTHMKIWITYMGPHAVAKGADKETYMDEICTKTLPLVAKEKLADFADIFVDEGFFTKDDMDRYCKVAQGLGLALKSHIDEIKNLGGAEIAAKYKIVSVDHCRHTTQDQLRLLKEAGVQVVMLPVTSFYIEEGFLPMKFFNDVGVKPAIASDYNPGSQPSLSWPFLLHLGMKKMGMNEMELLHATTVAPLNALKEKYPDWSFGLGKKCKLNLFEATSISELAYRYGENLLKREIFFA